MTEKELLASMGAKVKAARKQAKMTQVKLGQLCGLDDSSVSQIESGNYGSKITTLKRIADVLKMEVRDFL